MHCLLRDFAPHVSLTAIAVPKPGTGPKGETPARKK